MKTDTIANSNADDPTKALCSLSQNWWLFVLRGVLALIFAALAFWMPQSALLAMTIMFGAFSLVNGAFNLFAAVRHIQKKADITVVCKELPSTEDVTRFGVLKMNEDCRIEEFEEKPMVSNSNIVSTGIYVIRRRQLIELVERCAQEDRYDFVKDILIRYKNLKRIYGYKMQDYWSNIAAVDSYYRTNMDFLKPEVRNYFFHQYPDIYSKVDDLPPAKYNPGSEVRNSLVSAGCIINGTVENSILFKKVFVGENCVIKNSIILNDVYLGDNTHIENCIVESRDTIRANSYHVGEDDIKIVIEKNERYVL